MPDQTRLLVVDDDADIRELLSAYLARYDMTVETAADGAGLFEKLDHAHFDLIILDIMLPGEDGLSLCRRLRGTSAIPVIFLTARGSVDDRVRGLRMGAEDYIVKPFEVKELLARVHAVLRRTGDDGKPKSKKLTFDKLVINLDSYELIVDGKKIDTPPKEMELLYHLAATPNRVYTRNQLLDEVWGFDYFGDSRTVDVHIKRLREKLEGVSDKWALKTVWGVGYKFEAEET